MTDQAIQLPECSVDEEMERRRKLLHIMTVTGIVVCVLFLLLMMLPSIGGRWSYYVIFAVLLPCCVLSTLLNRKGHLRLAAYLFLFSLSLAIFGVILSAALYQQVVGFVIYYFPLTVLAAGMVLGSRATFRFATVNAALIVLITVLAYLTFDIDVETYGDEVISVTVPALVLCYLMALVAWLYGNSLEGALHRVTEQSEQLKQANMEIQAFSRGLEDKVEERTQQLRDFVSMVAHDLRSPLIVIRGYTEILQEEREPASNQPQERALVAISTNVEQMLCMTDELLEIAHLQSGTVQLDIEALPIEAVIEEVRDSFGHVLAEKRLGLRVDVAPELPCVLGDRSRLNRVLSNLLMNAYNYTPAGEIVVSARPLDGLVEVSVSDTGIGIPPEDQDRLFTRFFRGQHRLVRRHRGTGLGLPIARSIVRAHGGEIWVESEVGKGSTFRFTLPQAPGQTNQGLA